jgi:hypothetical protein
MQIRKYLFGGLTNVQLRDYVNGKTKRILFKGMMSFYPLVNDETQLKSLDGWLVSVIHRSLALRLRLLQNVGLDRSRMFPFAVAKKDLISEFRKRKLGRNRFLEIPSFMLIYKAIELGLKNEGIERVMNPSSNRYSYRF